MGRNRKKGRKRNEGEIDPKFTTVPNSLQSERRNGFWKGWATIKSFWERVPSLVKVISATSAAVGIALLFPNVRQEIPGPEEPSIDNRDPKNWASSVFKFRNRTHFLEMKSVQLFAHPNGIMASNAKFSGTGGIIISQEPTDKDDYDPEALGKRPKPPINLEAGTSIEAVLGDYIAPRSATNYNPILKADLVPGSTITWVVTFKTWFGSSHQSAFSFLLVQNGDGLYWKVEPRKIGPPKGF